MVSGLIVDDLPVVRFWFGVVVLLLGCSGCFVVAFVVRLLIVLGIYVLVAVYVVIFVGFLLCGFYCCVLLVVGW